MPRSVREQLILGVAGEVFAEGGYERASMDRIARLAGVSKPMLYAYFGSKEGLYLAYVERTGSALVQRLVRADGNGAASPPRRLRTVISEFLAFVEEHRHGWTVLFRELNGLRPLAEQVATLRAQIVAEVQRMLEGDGTSAGLEPPASEAIAAAIVGAGESLANWWMHRPDVARSDVVEWYVGLARAAILTATRGDD
jgi:AcrR family transcriptional regulator